MSIADQSYVYATSTYHCSSSPGTSVSKGLLLLSKEISQIQREKNPFPYPVLLILVDKHFKLKICSKHSGMSTPKKLVFSNRETMFHKQVCLY